jgi:hypothetical protein
MPLFWLILKKCHTKFKDMLLITAVNDCRRKVDEFSPLNQEDFV